MSLLSYVEVGNYNCKQIHILTATHAAELEEKIQALQEMELVLEEMIEHCSNERASVKPAGDRQPIGSLYSSVR